MICMIPSLWVAPIQIIVGVGLLGNLGYSALFGLGVFLLAFPIQFGLVKIMVNQRKKGVGFTGKRIWLTTEVLQGIRLIKFYAWENFYIDRLGELRAREIRAIKKTAYITYALSGHDLNVAIIFTSLQLFNIIRMPLAFLPFVLSIFADALVALRRISKFLLSEELDDAYLIGYEQQRLRSGQELRERDGQGW
ncbi:hypothetical protein H0H92_007294 [Tricholoma furcatifolium]|nr:hypothetical protein H0H92_007294 [Tricholoma furcatifolium]